MKFSRKFKQINISKRLSYHSRKKLSKRDLPLKINEVKTSKKKFRFPFLNQLIRYKKQDKLTKTPSLRIKELENEFMNTVIKMHHRSESPTCQQGEHRTLVNQRLLITRSVDNCARVSRKRYLGSLFISEPDYQSDILPERRNNEITDSSIKLPSEPINYQENLSSKISMKSESCLKKHNSLTHRKLSLHWDENSLKSTLKQYQQQEAAIIDIEYSSYVSTSSSSNFSKPLEKSHSSPLPINTNHSSISNNCIHSAHIIDQYQYEKKSGISLYSCVSEMENDESSSSDEERSLLQYPKNITRKNLRHRWSVFDIWEKTMAKVPTILNCIWRQQLYRTGSREFLLEYDQILPTNNNRANFAQEQRYVEQERPINSHIGLALLALLIFPPVGILAIILSVWSLCGQQDRHLSRKFGNAVYWISLLSICLSFLLLFTLFTYFTCQYLINRPIIINQYRTSHHPPTNNIDYI